MSLTPEQQERILQEEKQRLAEEEYRAQVRKELLGQSVASGSTSAPLSPPIPLKATTTFKLLAFAAVLAGLGVVYMVIGNRSHWSESRRQSESTGATAQPEGEPSPVEKTKALVKLTTEQIAEGAKRSVVVIHSFGEDNQPLAQGSGYISSSEGMVVTNYHVIRGANSLQIETPSRGELHLNEVVGYDPAHDVAVLAVTEGSLPAFQSEPTDQTKVGDRVVAVGAPFGLDQTVTEGIISAKRNLGAIELIQTSAAISPGSSGGPLIDEHGKVIGLNTFIRAGGENLNFAVPVRYLATLVARQRRMPLSQMLEETHVVTHFSNSSITVQAHNMAWFTFTVSQPTGATLTGTFEIYGGGRDVNVYLTNIDGGMLANFGRTIGEGRITRHLPPGQYKLVFDNRFSMITAKSVMPDLGVEFYK